MKLLKTAIVVLACVVGCAAEDDTEAPREQTEALARSDGDEAFDLAAARAAASGKQAGVKAEHRYAIDDAGAITSASGAKVALPASEIYEPDSQSTARLIGGGGFGGGGVLSAWGCWTGSCCAAGHYEAGPVGWVWVCDAWEPCERCIWPY